MNDPQTVTERHVHYTPLSGGGYDITFDPPEGCTQPPTAYGRAVQVINEYINGDNETVTFAALDDLDRESVIDVARLAMIRLREIKHKALDFSVQISEDL